MDRRIRRMTREELMREETVRGKKGENQIHTNHIKKIKAKRKKTDQEIQLEKEGKERGDRNCEVKELRQQLNR